MHLQTIYQQTIKFATAKHVEQQQLVPGTNLPYAVHISNVAMEVMIAGFNTEKFDTGFAVQVALLHDTLEDTSTTFEELEDKFGADVAHAVSALTKNNELPKEQRMADCMARIKKLQPEVWAVKLADRITNLQPPPPDWDKIKRAKYREEARLILNELKDGNEFLANRLQDKIDAYGVYI